MKQVIIVNASLKMSKGKVCAQVAHASLFAALKAKKKHPIKFNRWISTGAKKVVVKAKEEELLELKAKADKIKLPNELIRDAGYTEVLPGSITALGIGPDDDEIIDKITGHLKLL